MKRRVDNWNSGFYKNNKKRGRSNMSTLNYGVRGQVSFEYLVIVGFVTLVIIGVLSLSITYTNSLRDQVNVNQMQEFAEEVISTSEYVFYSGAPSKATISVYLPEDIDNITIAENTIFFEIDTATGRNKIGFPSSVNISGAITSTAGVKNLEITAYDTYVNISQL